MVTADKVSRQYCAADIFGRNASFICVLNNSDSGIKLQAAVDKFLSAYFGKPTETLFKLNNNYFQLDIMI